MPCLHPLLAATLHLHLLQATTLDLHPLLATTLHLHPLLVTTLHLHLLLATTLHPHLLLATTLHLHHLLVSTQHPVLAATLHLHLLLTNYSASPAGNYCTSAPPAGNYFASALPVSNFSTPTSEEVNLQHLLAPPDHARAHSLAVAHPFPQTMYPSVATPFGSGSSTQAPDPVLPADPTAPLYGHPTALWHAPAHATAPAQQPRNRIGKAHQCCSRQ